MATIGQRLSLGICDVSIVVTHIRMEFILPHPQCILEVARSTLVNGFMSDELQYSREHAKGAWLIGEADYAADTSTTRVCPRYIATYYAAG